MSQALEIGVSQTGDNMSDIVLSFAKADKDIAEAMAYALGGEGYTVDPLWKKDPEKVSRQLREKAIARAKAVMVLWSTKSVRRNDVRLDAREAHAEDKYIPILLEECDIPKYLQIDLLTDIRGWAENSHQTDWSAADQLRDIGFYDIQPSKKKKKNKKLKKLKKLKHAKHVPIRVKKDSGGFESLPDDAPAPNGGFARYAHILVVLAGVVVMGFLAGGYYFKHKDVLDTILHETDDGQDGRYIPPWQRKAPPWRER